MCYQIIETHACGHKAEHFIPCEKLTEGSCNAAPEATQDQFTENAKDCRKCKDRKAEDEAFEADMRRIAEDPDLAPMPKTGGVGRPSGGFGVFKQRTRWLRCNHVSHPILLDIERESADDQEWFEIDERGSCHACCEANPRLLAAMKESGELDQEDPWGAMNVRPEVAAGSSSRPGAGLLPPHPALRFDDDEPSRSPSPDQIPTLTRGKGKGRAGRPEETYASRYGAAEEPKHEEEDKEEAAAHSAGEESDDDELRPPPAKSSKPPKYGDSDDDEDDDDDEEEARPARGRRTTRRLEGSSSRGSSSKLDPRRRGSSGGASSQYSVEEGGEAPHWGSKPPPGSPPPHGARRDSMDPPDLDDEEEDEQEEEEVIEVSPRERAKYGIPPSLPMTETKLKVWKQSKASAGGA